MSSIIPVAIIAQKISLEEPQRPGNLRKNQDKLDNRTIKTCLNIEILLSLELKWKTLLVEKYNEYK